MSSIDDELARFEAEIRSIEESTAKSKKRKEVTGNKNSVSNSQKKIKVKEDVIFAPPKPAILPHDRLTDDSNTAVPAALSGFLPGTTGDDAISAGTYKTNSTTPQIPRVDMTTGRPLTAEEMHMLQQQQSVYEYDPSKHPVSRPTAASGSRDNTISRRRNQKFLRVGGGKVWEDKTLSDWPDNDFRIFCGDLGNEVTDELLAHAFSKYSTFQRARVVRDKHSFKSKGFGFVSFGDPFDCAKALREMNGKYIGNRPVKLSKSKWEDRNIEVAKKKMKRKRKNKNHLFT